MDSDAEFATDEYYNYAEFFSQFTNKELAHIRQEYGGLLDRNLREKIFTFVCEYRYTFELKNVSNEFGRPSGPGYLDDLHQWFETKTAEWEAEEEREMELRMARWKKLEDNARPFKEQIQALIAAIIGPPRKRGMADARIYHQKQSSLYSRILEYLWNNQSLPTKADLTDE
jgi:hypothetical protein